MGRVTLPISDYMTDTKSALDNSLRVLQAICDAAGDAGYLSTALAAMALVQSLMQVECPHDLPKKSNQVWMMVITRTVSLEAYVAVQQSVGV